MRHVRGGAVGTPVRHGDRGLDGGWILALTGVALLVRVLTVTLIGSRGVVFNDSTFYVATAESLASGHGYAIQGLATAQWPPGYSMLLSVVFRVFWPSMYVAQVTNAVLGALTVPLLFVLVRRLFSRRAALIAAAVLALLPGALLWSDIEVAETFYTFVLLAVFVLLTFLPQRWWTPVVLGLAIGIATLVRGEGLLLIPAAMVVWWTRRPVGAQMGRTLVALVTIPVVFALVLLPWGLRNSRAMGQFVPLSTNSSTTLWSGHNPAANGYQNYAGPDLLGNLPPNGPPHELQEAKILRSQAITYARTHPRRELELIPLKLMNLLRGDAYVMDWVNSGSQKPVALEFVNPLRVAADIGFYGVFAAAVLSMVLGGRRLWRHPTMRGLSVVLLLSLFLYGFVYYGNYRYRFPLTPFLVLLASPMLAALWDVRNRIRPGAAGAVPVDASGGDSFEARGPAEPDDDTAQDGVRDDLREPADNASSTVRT